MKKLNKKMAKKEKIPKNKTIQIIIQFDENLLNFCSQMTALKPKKKK